MGEKLNNPGENKGSSNSKVSKGKEDIPDPQDVAVPLWAALAQSSRTMATIRSMMAAPQSAQAAHVMGDMKSQSNEQASSGCRSNFGNPPHTANDDVI